MTKQKFWGLVFATALSAGAHADDDISLFNGSGKPEAYIAVTEELTIYLWTGKPVAYLKKDDSNGGFHVYGFNGKHLGWFTKGAVWDHDGNASCATKEVLRTTQYEPYKSYKEYKPYKSYAEYGPYRPSLKASFGDIPCRLLLGQGAS